MLRDCGLVVDDLIEVRAPEGGRNEFGDEVSLDWARRWPAEEVWFAHRPRRRLTAPPGYRSGR